MSDTKQLVVDIQKNIDDRELEQTENSATQLQAAKPATTAIIDAAVDRIFNIQDERLIRKKLNPFLFYKHMPLALVTEQAESYENLSIQWSFSNGQFDPRRGVISSKQLVKNIIGMRISGGIFPWVPMSAIPYQRQIFILVDEFSAFAMRNRWISYHFIMTPTIEQFDIYEDQGIRYGPYIPSFDGYFWFPSPVQDLNTITLRFAVQNMYFDARRVALSATIYPTWPEYNENPMQLPYPQNGELVDGMRYYFEYPYWDPYVGNFTSLIQEQGQPITDIGGGYFTVPVDGSDILYFDTVRVWTTPVEPINFSLKIDFIYLGDQDASFAR